MGDDSAAIAHSLEAERIDPATRYITYNRRGRIACFNGEPERAAAFFDTAVALESDYADGYIYGGLARAAAGDLDGAAAAADLQRSGPPRQARGFLALVDALEGRAAEARSALREFGHPDREVHWARVLTVLGEEERALDYLEQGRVHSRYLTDPLLDPLRRHPRFQALLARYRTDGER
jgi:tetratricopeptide (TPR) repeat protein